LLVPPHELLPLRPGPAVGVGRGAVVHDTAVGGPGEAPLRLERGIRVLALGGAGAAPPRGDAAVGPAAPRPRARLPPPLAARSCRRPSARGSRAVGAASRAAPLARLGSPGLPRDSR